MKRQLRIRVELHVAWLGHALAGVHLLDSCPQIIPDLVQPDLLQTVRGLGPVRWHPLGPAAVRLTLLLTFDWFSCLSLKSYSSIGSSGARGRGGATLREQRQTGKKPVRNKKERYTIRVETFEQTSFLCVVCINKWQKTNRNLLSDADSADISYRQQH